MALGPDDTVCFCFHVTRRKIETFCRVERPQHASQISDCLSAGTGCGWCRPILRKLHEQQAPAEVPWWRQPASEASPVDLDALTPDAHRAGRRAYISQGKGTPPPGAEE